MRILVVGAGFLGVGIANRLANAGHEVVVLSRRKSVLLDSHLQTLEFRYGRVDRGANVDSLLTGVDCVVDAASSQVPATVQASPALAISESLSVSSWLAERSVANGVSCLVYLSSGGTVYGDGSHAHLEDEVIAPVSVYGAMKAAAETCNLAIARGSQTRVVNLRIANVFGPGQNLERPQGLVGVALRNHFQGRRTVLFGANETVRDFIHLNDVADLCATVIRSDHRGALNAGSGMGLSLSDMVSRCGLVVGESIAVEYLPIRDFDVRTSVLDISLANSLGWSPQVELMEGLEQTWQWIQLELSSWVD